MKHILRVTLALTLAVCLSASAALPASAAGPDAVPSADTPIYSAQNVVINSPTDAVELSADLVNTLKGLHNASIIVKYQNTNTSVGSFFSISDPTKVNAHFHIYESGNAFGFELRNSDNPKYSGTCRVYGGELNTVAFKAEAGVGYKLFANGELGSAVSKTGADYLFLDDMNGLTTSFIGKLKRSNDENSYPFTGTIEFI